MNQSETNSLDELRQIVSRLRAPDGCPWDREQTHHSIRGCLIEEAYEVVEAINNHDDPHLCEELGDFLLQVIMHCQIASERDAFDLDAVARGITEKLRRRHPHVFGEKKLGTSGAVLKQWDQIKREEKNAPSNASILDGISPALPALIRAEKVQKKAARVGFDWNDPKDVLDKIREETAEVEEALQDKDREKLEAEIGDLFFSVVNFSRKAGIEPELAMERATRKFIKRFRQLEELLRQRGQKFEEMDLAGLDAIWEEIKNQSEKSR